MKKRHTPTRTCIVCRKTFAKKDITRYVFSREENSEYGRTLVIDENQIKEGRGYYVCASLECQQKFAKKGCIRRKRKEV